MNEKMTEQEARQTLLELLQNGLEEWRSRDHEDRHEVMELREEIFNQFVSELGWDPRETWALYKRLVRGGYIYQVRGETKFLELRGLPQYAWVEDLTDKGMMEIGKLLDPQQQFVTGLEAAIQAMRDNDRLSEDEK